MKGFIKGEALRPLRNNSSKAKFDEHITLFKQRLQHRGYPDNLLNMTLSEVKLSEVNYLKSKDFAVCCRIPPDLKHILMNKWHLTQNQPLISYRKGRSLKNVLVRAKL